MPTRVTLRLIYVSLLLIAAGLGPFAQLDRLQPGHGQLLLWANAGATAALMLVAHALAGELVRLDERWQLALAGSALGVADWNLRTGESFTSACWQSLMDDPHGAQGRSLAHWLAQVHADDRPALDAALAPQSPPASASVRARGRSSTRTIFAAARAPAGKTRG